MKIDKKLKKNCIGVAGSDWRETYDLIQEEKRQAVEGFIKDVRQVRYWESYDDKPSVPEMLENLLEQYLL